MANPNTLRIEITSSCPEELTELLNSVVDQIEAESTKGNLVQANGATMTWDMATQTK